MLSPVGTAQGTQRGAVVIWGLLAWFGIKGKWGQKEKQPTLDQISWLRSGSQGLGGKPAARASDEATQPPGITHQGER